MKILPPGADHGQQFSKPLPIFVHHFKLSLKFRKSSKWWTKIHTRLSEEGAGTKVGPDQLCLLSDNIVIRMFKLGLDL